MNRNPHGSTCQLQDEIVLNWERQAFTAFELSFDYDDAAAEFEAEQAVERYLESRGTCECGGTRALDGFGCLCGGS